MSRILIAYATNSGSTAEAADAVAAELTQQGHNVEVKSCREVISPADYDSVIIGAPMIFGWHGDARKFVRKFGKTLAAKKTAYFACAMRLTDTPAGHAQDIPLLLDASLAAEPVKSSRLSFKENFTSLEHYLKPMLACAPEVKPVSIAFFNGKLEMYRLKWWQALFVMAVVQGAPGDYRDWDVIKGWAQSISALL
jgi:menaquinone-dependent protoporphyrinogen oxidase